MSKSIHTTYKDLKGVTKSGLEEMSSNPDSILNELAEKRAIKRKVEKDRRDKKQRDNTEETD